MLGVLSLNTNWLELTTANLSIFSTSTTLPESSWQEQSEPSEPETLQQKLDSTREQISSLRSRLIDLSEAEQIRDALDEIREKRSRGFGGFNFSEGRKAVSEMLEVMKRIEKLPIDEMESELLEMSRSAADSRFGSPASVYAPIHQLAGRLCERRRKLNRQLQQLEDLEQELIRKLDP